MLWCQNTVWLQHIYHGWRIKWPNFPQPRLIIQCFVYGTISITAIINTVVIVGRKKETEYKYRANVMALSITFSFSLIYWLLTQISTNIIKAISEVFLWSQFPAFFLIFILTIHLPYIQRYSYDTEWSFASEKNNNQDCCLEG